MSHGCVDLTRLLAFAAELEADDVPSDVRDRAPLAIVDTVAAIVAGSTAPEVAAYRASAVGAEGPATVFAPGLPSADAEEAAFANALAATWWEVDEVGPWGHAAAHVLPALLAAAEADGRSGEELLAAFVGGYEVHARLARAATMHPELHQHGTVGVVAAAVALGRLCGASVEEIENTAAMAGQLMLATSYAGSVAGATVRNAHPALAARAAFLTRRLHACGFTGDVGGWSRVFETVLGSRFDAAGLTDGLGETWALSGAAFKLHSGCGHLHPVLDALADALGAEARPGTYPPVAIEPLDPALVDRVDVRVVPGAERLSDPEPPNDLAARFSIPFAAATFLAGGSASVGPATATAAVRALARRIHVQPDAELVRTADRLPARVVIRFANGDVARGACDAPYGWPARPATRADVEAKFRALAAPPLGGEAEELLRRLSSLQDLRAVSLRVAGREAAARE